MKLQAMKVQQDSVDSYLEDIITRAGEQAADQEARQEIKEHAAAIDRAADEIDKRSVLSLLHCCFIGWMINHNSRQSN